MANPVIGLIVMSASANMEHGYHKMTPAGVNIAVSRVPFRELSYDGLVGMINELPEAALTLMEEHPSVIVVPSFLASVIKGTEIVNLLQQTTGVPVLVPAQEYLKVFRELEISRIGVLSVYSSELILLEKAFFSMHGISVARVVQVEEMVNVDPYLMRDIPVERLVDAALKTDFSNVDAVIFDNSYFNFRQYIGTLEQSIGRPILSLNSILLRAALKMIGAPTSHLFVSKYFSN